MRSIREIIRRIHPNIIWTSISYSIELSQDLKAVRGLDAETELRNILDIEIDAWKRQYKISDYHQVVEREYCDDITLETRRKIGLRQI